MAGNIDVEIVAPIACTESEEKVIRSVSNIFPGVDLRRDGEAIAGFASTLSVLERLRMQVRARRIRASARAVILKGVKSGSLTFYIDKQAAYMGRVSFWDPSEKHMPSPIMVRVRTENPMDVVEWLTR